MIDNWFGYKPSKAINPSSKETEVSVQTSNPHTPTKSTTNNRPNHNGICGATTTSPSIPGAGCPGEAEAATRTT